MICDDVGGCIGGEGGITKRIQELPSVKKALEKYRNGEESMYRTPCNYIPPPRPILPTSRKLFKLSISAKLRVIQRYISSFDYNYTGISFVHPRKDRGMKHLMHVAQVIMRDALPIQCVEAVFVAVSITHGMDELVRIPISFRSRFKEEEHCHMVLAIQNRKKKKSAKKDTNDGGSNSVMSLKSTTTTIATMTSPTTWNCSCSKKNGSDESENQGFWGALGISRLDKLMYKPCIYPTLADLIDEYAQCYTMYSHCLQEVSLGLPFPHDQVSETPVVQWKCLKLSLSNKCEIQIKRSSMLLRVHKQRRLDRPHRIGRHECKNDERDDENDHHDYHGNERFEHDATASIGLVEKSQRKRRRPTNNTRGSSSMSRYMDDSGIASIPSSHDASWSPKWHTFYRDTLIQYSKDCNQLSKRYYNYGIPVLPTTGKRELVRCDDVPTQQQILLYVD